MDELIDDEESRYAAEIFEGEARKVSTSTISESIATEVGEVQFTTQSLPDLHKNYSPVLMTEEEIGDDFEGEAMPNEIEFDLTEEQTLATLKYFTSTGDRTSLLSKAHGDDLDVLSGLLQEKEKDLEIAARIGQSLLLRNKNLIMQIESMEDFLNNATERETQIRHDLEKKTELMKKVIRDQDELEHRFNWSSNESSDSYSIDDSCKDESIVLLQKKCQKLEHANSDLFAEAINLRSMTFEEEDKEQQLVLDCIKQLSEAKQQITNLTDEIAMKFEDNVQQQDEITQLINTVVELQRKHKELSWENGSLQQQLDVSQQDQQCLRSQVHELQRKFTECYEMLQENQVEVKTLKNKVEICDFPSWHSAGSSSGFYQDSLAMELEDSMQSDSSSREGKASSHTSKVMGAVKKTNRFLEHRDQHRSVSGRTSPSQLTIGSESGGALHISDSLSDSASQVPSQSSGDNSIRRQRRGYGPERLQIVKPLEGSNTLHHWQELANQESRGGLFNLASQGDRESVTEAEVSQEVRLEDLENDLFEDESEAATKPSTKNMIKLTEESTEDKQKQFNQRRADKLAQKYDRTKVDVSKGVMMKNPLKPASNKPKTIVTRNSTILTSLREGRELLNKKDGSKSKTEVIDMIANAMSKVNLEAKTGQRILESLSTPSKSRKKSQGSPVRKAYPEMPKVTKLLGKIKPEEIFNAPDPDRTNEERSFSPLGMLQDSSGRKHTDSSASGSTTSSILSSSSSRLLSGIFASSSNGLLRNSVDAAGEVKEPTPTAAIESPTETIARPTLTRSHSSGDLGSLTRGNLNNVAFPPGGLMGRIRRNSGGINILGIQQNDDNNSSFIMPKRMSTSSGNLVDLIRDADLTPNRTDLTRESTHASGGTVSTNTSNGFLRSLFGANRVPTQTVQSIPTDQPKSKSVEKGLKSFGRALAQDDFGGFGMMSMFTSSSGRKNSDN